MKDKFNIDMPTKVISSYKTSIQARAKKGPGKKRGRKPGQTAAALIAVVPVAAKGGGISLDDIRAVKELANRLGADKLSELAAVLAR